MGDDNVIRRAGVKPADRDKVEAALDLCRGEIMDAIRRRKTGKGTTIVTGLTLHVSPDGTINEAFVQPPAKAA